MRRVDAAGSERLAALAATVCALDQVDAGERLLAEAVAGSCELLGGTAAGSFRGGPDVFTADPARRALDAKVARHLLASDGLASALNRERFIVFLPPDPLPESVGWIVVATLLAGDEVIGGLWVAGAGSAKALETAPIMVVAATVSARLAAIAAGVEALRLRAELRSAESHRHKFLANMSHELRTPLNAVIGFSELLMSDSRSDDERRKFLSFIHGGGVHLLGLINDVLDLSRLEAGLLELRLGPIDPRALLVEVAAMVGGLAAEREVQIQLEPGEEGEMVADEAKLRQVLTNLLSGAVAFSPRGEIVTAGVVKDGAGWVFTVSDAGPEAGPADLDHDLAEFGQVPERSGAKRGGSGLGLALSRRLAEAHGGRLEVECAAGRNLFRLAIPVVMMEGDPVRHRHMLAAGRR